MPDLVSNSFLSWVTNNNLKTIFSSLILLLLITAVAIGVDYLIRKTLIRTLDYKLKTSKWILAQLIVKHHVFSMLALIFFGLVFVFGSFFLVSNTNPFSVSIANITLKCANLFNLYILTVAINRFISALHDYYQHISDRENKSSWHSYIKIVIFFTWILAGILAIAYVFGKPPTSILTGLGALSALVLLIFRDTILGIVSSIQANATSMVRIGDWISINKFDIDGIVEEISINSVRIRNFDNTITTIPTYSITTEAVINWEYMTKSQGRRFKEAILIDPNSITLVDASFLDKLNSLEFVASPKIENAFKENTATNLMLFREFIGQTILRHKDINHTYLNMVRITRPNVQGVPLEITAFTTKTSLVEHESIKAQILEVSFATIKLFDLKLNLKTS